MRVLSSRMWKQSWVRLFLAKVQRRHLTSRSRRWCGGEMVAGGLPAR